MIDELIQKQVEEIMEEHPIQHRFDCCIWGVGDCNCDYEAMKEDYEAHLVRSMKKVGEAAKKEKTMYKNIMGASDFMLEQGISDDDVFTAGEVEELLQNYIHSLTDKGE